MRWLIHSELLFLLWIQNIWHWFWQKFIFFPYDRFCEHCAKDLHFSGLYLKWWWKWLNTKCSHTPPVLVHFCLPCRLPFFVVRLSIMLFSVGLLEQVTHGIVFLGKLLFFYVFVSLYHLCTFVGSHNEILNKGKRWSVSDWEYKSIKETVNTKNTKYDFKSEDNCLAIYRLT